MISVTVAEQRDMLSAFFRTLTGVTTVYKRWPRELQDSELPALILRVGPGHYAKRGDAMGSDTLVIEREWIAALYVKRVTQGAEFGAEEAAEPFLTVIPDGIATKQRLTSSATDGLRKVDIDIDRGGDTAVKYLPYNDQTYAGVEVSFYTVTYDFVTHTSN